MHYLPWRHKNPDHRPTARQDLVSTLLILAGALLVAVLIIMFVFRSYEVDGPSMEQTLHDNDKLIIWKVPRTWARITGNSYIPNRGDVVVFNEASVDSYSSQAGKQLIKRVIGLPGERVTVRNGGYVIFNRDHPSGFNPDASLPTGRQHEIYRETTGTVDVTLGPSQVFVSGDNRPESLDSRTFGPIDADQIIGKLVLRVFPLGHAKPF